MDQKPISCVRHGMLRQLPPGFRFHPSDEELVVQYLKRKVYSCPLPASIIPEIDLRMYDPWDLPACGGCEEARYFFSLKEAKYPTNRSRSNRAARSGFWKATGKDKPVMSSKLNQVVGMKKVLVFHRGKPSTTTRTDWIMHEYRLLAGHDTTTSSIFPQRNSSTHSSMVPNGDWVLCRIFKKKRSTKMDIEIEEDDKRDRIRNDDTSFIDSMTPGDVDRSCVTELCDGSSDGEEASSTSMSSPP